MSFGHKVLYTLLIVRVASTKGIVTIVSQQHQDGVVGLTARGDSIHIGCVVAFVTICPTHGLHVFLALHVTFNYSGSVCVLLCTIAEGTTIILVTL